MHKERVNIANINFGFIRLRALVIGTGAAGLNAAVQLSEKGIEDLAIITEKWGGGASNNAGSDKQTYYRLAPDSPQGDSVIDMALSLFQGGAMHGDIALIEASLSSQAFYHLVSAGVPFPHDRYGRYPGYITDHDTKGRGTSAGPLTGKLMFEALAAKVVNAKIPILDKYQVVKLLIDDDSEITRLVGAVALNLDISGDSQPDYLLIQAENVMMATGGPGGLYESSVYPHGQNGAMGLALEIGAKACNLTESQFGIASIKFRWNLSGSYQQVIPRYFSVDQNDVEHEFLSDYFDEPSDLIEAIFLKGYQWPFDARKVSNGGSSVIDLLVYRERYQYKRRVFIDYRRNPLSKSGKEIDVLSGGETVLDYLKSSGAVASTPVLRLEQMNKPAVDLYRSKGIDLHREALEIDVCAQHCNGGLQGSIWWESNIKNLFPIGEANGSHGVYRPGGSALNAGQVGGIRAAQKISSEKAGFRLKRTAFIEKILEQISDFNAMHVDTDNMPGIEELDEELLQIRERMSKYAAFIRSQRDIDKALEEAIEQHQRVLAIMVPSDRKLASRIFSLREHTITQICFLEAIKTHIAKTGESRGSYLVIRNSGENAVPWDDAQLFYELEKNSAFTHNNQLLVSTDNGAVTSEWQAVRPIPEETEWFEKLWKEFRGGVS